MRLQKKSIRILSILVIFLIVITALFLFKQSPMFKTQINKTEVSSELEDSVDTTPPSITCDIKTKTIRAGETLSIAKLGVRATDSSEIESVAFTKISSDYFYTGLPEEKTQEMRAAYKKGIEFFSEELQFSYGGTYSLTIEACDTFQNRSEITLTIKVEEPPIIETPSGFYIAEGSKIDFLEHIKAWDFMDENFSIEDVEVDSSSVNLGSIGTYPISFTGTDNYGLTTSTSSTVHILSQDDLQELINTHQINLADSIIIGAYNKYDLGYFENESLYSVSTYIQSAVLHVENSRNNTFGSGFIVHIDDDLVTIATCYELTEQCITPKITFSDGTTCLGSVVAQNKESDVAFIQIPIDGTSENTSLSLDYVKNLRTIHIDESYWSTIPNNSALPLGYVCINNEDFTWNYSAGTLVNKDIKKDFGEYKDIHQMLVSMEPQSGSSGSAIFDETGRLLGMVRGHSNDEDDSTVKFGVPLSEILRLYELTFKEK